MKRLGMALVPQSGISMPDYIAMAQLAEQQGYEVIWGAESNGYKLFSFLSVLLSQTQRIKVAPSIASIFYAHAGLDGDVGGDLASGRPGSKCPWTGREHPHYRG